MSTRTKMSGGGCRLSQVDGKEHNCCDWRGSGRTPGSQSSALRQAIGSTHKLQQRRRPMSLRQASMTTCLTRMVELRRGYQDSTTEDAVARENKVQEIPSDWAALENSGKHESDKETGAGAQDAL